jgi:iron complex transport system permease protein
MASYTDVLTLLPYLVVGLVFAYFYSKELNVLLLGEEMAMTLGVEVVKVRRLMIVIATLMTAAAVSVSGLIGFVGLIVPHFVRILIGPNHRALVPLSALGGALLMVLADALGRTVLSPMEIPIGVMMALVGSPFFLYILKRRRMGKK